MSKLTECLNYQMVKINNKRRNFFNVPLLNEVITDTCLFLSRNSCRHNFSEPFKVCSSFHAVCSAKTKFFRDDKGLNGFLHTARGPLRHQQRVRLHERRVPGTIKLKQPYTKGDKATKLLVNLEVA